MHPINEADCLLLPLDETPASFDDDIIPPEPILARGWSERFGESFATTVNNWVVDGSPAPIEEGTLNLSAGETATRPDANTVYEDVYYTWTGTPTRFSFQERFAVEMSADAVRLYQDDVLLNEAAVTIEDTYTLGVLLEEQSITIFLNDALLLETVVDRTPTAGYAFAAGQILRFEIIAPIPPME
jgi:hypothetical protein